MADFNSSSAILTYTQSFNSINVWSMGCWVYADSAPPQFSSIWQSRSSGFVGFTASNGSVGGQNDFQMDWEGNLFSNGTSINLGIGKWGFVAGVVNVAAGTVSTYISQAGSLTSSVVSGQSLTAKSPSSWSVGADSFLSSSRTFDGALCHLIAEVSLWSTDQIIALGRMHPLDVVRAPAFYRELYDGIGRRGIGSADVPMGTSVGIRGGAPIMPRRIQRPYEFQVNATSPPPPPSTVFRRTLSTLGTRTGSRQQQVA